MEVTPTTKWVIICIALLALVFVGVWMTKASPKEALISAVALISGGEQASTTIDTPKPLHYHYIEVTNGCGPYYDTGTCVNMRSGPGVTYPVVGRLRTGVVLKVEGTTIEKERAWYKIIFDGEIRYPERVKGDWYVAVDPTSVLSLENVGDEDLTKGTASTSKRIIVDMSQQKLYAYDGDTLFMKELISTGHDATPTPAGTFSVFRKTPSRYMQGPIPEVSDQYYDLPGVPWNLYFTTGGAVIHGAYWHDNFGKEWSHGCVNLPPQQAKKLYLWADVGTSVTVRR